MRIACITGPLTTTTGSHRYLGYSKAIEGGGLAVDGSLVRVGDFRERGGRLAMQELLANKLRPDAVFVANHLMTIGALRYRGGEIGYSQRYRGGQFRRHALVDPAAPDAYRCRSARVRPGSRERTTAPQPARRLLGRGQDGHALTVIAGEGQLRTEKPPKRPARLRWATGASSCSRNDQGEEATNAEDH